jgi:hypothetical protein
MTCSANISIQKIDSSILGGSTDRQLKKTEFI